MRKVPVERLLGSKYRVYSPQYQEEWFIFQKKGGEKSPDGYLAISLGTSFGSVFSKLPGW